MVSDSAPPGPVLDFEGALARLGGDQELFAEMVGFLHADLPALRDELRAAVVEGDPNRIRMNAHALKGFVASCGGVRAATAAQALEDAGHAGDVSQINSLVDSLNAELDHLMQALAKYR